LSLVDHHVFVMFIVYELASPIVCTSVLDLKHVSPCPNRSYDLAIVRLYGCSNLHQPLYPLNVHHENQFRLVPIHQKSYWTSARHVMTIISTALCLGVVTLVKMSHQPILFLSQVTVPNLYVVIPSVKLTVSS